jgi:hypothetical protein
MTARSGPRSTGPAIFDVFNGDADGICALHQLRLHDPQPRARLITGVKRDVALLERLGEVEGSRITVLDISLDRNRAALMRLLDRNNRIFYVDHHYSGEIPVQDNLECRIDPSPLVCTSLIIDQILVGRHRPWAIVGAFGDNLDDVATGLAGSLDWSTADIARLQEIGRLLNYNGYGMVEADLLIHPAELYREVSCFADPRAFAGESALIVRLRDGYAADMEQARALTPYQTSASARVFLLPDAPWARRVVGVFANRLAREEPDMAHATLIPRGDNSLLISVRAPLANRQGADTLCRRFVTGGGRASAAGINALPMAQLDAFLNAFADHFAHQQP